MISGYILEKYNDMGQHYTCTRIIEEAAKRGIAVDMIGIRDTYLCNGSFYNNGKELARRDFVINRYKWGKLKDEMALLSERTYNDTKQFDLYVNKFSQLQHLSCDQFLIPRHILGSADTPYRELAAYLGGTMVAKGLESSMGREILLIKKEKDMEQLISYGADKEWLFEEFIENSCGRDLRIYSVRGKALAAMIRESSSDFRANVALGAHTCKYAVDDRIRTIAKAVYEQTALDFVGIDLLFGENALYFCEINVMPGIQGIEETTGVNIAGVIMDTIEKDFYE